MAANAKLANDPPGEFIDVTLYRSMIGCLLYLTASRLDMPLVLVFVLDFNLIIKFHTKFHTRMLSKELLNMLVELVIMD